ncbi:predicted protein [Naegleria gruberi]|uniref:Predicted protein n=1 Tax=Naegleria gruberi TaxID=5762 RepID=D2VZC5_NAEGR|nr:uncharacterized protein NAEGRDRAFT_74442 [Naegleria gruberi]EFC37822.1 predicted protein [Naegleria gruberi]|eukprot:XP_002670566.1 predicted protein [Naegleria gruberi strain NEG-M]
MLLTKHKSLIILTIISIPTILFFFLQIQTTTRTSPQNESTTISHNSCITTPTPLLSSSQTLPATTLINKDNDKTLSITIVSGGNRTTSDETTLLIKSILLNHVGNTQIELNIATDLYNMNFLIENVFNRIKVYRTQLNVNFKIVNLTRIDEECNELKIPIVHHSGKWGMVKLFLDKVFDTVKRTIFVDTDMVFGTNPDLLFSEFDKFKEETLFSWTREPNWESKGPNHVCSCIFLWDMKKTRKVNYLKEFAIPASIEIFGFDEKTQQISKEKRNGSDQDFLFALNKMKPNFFNELDPSWNLANCQNFFGVPSRSRSADRTTHFMGAIHFNCAGNTYDDWKGWEWVKEYLIWYRWDWFSRPYENNKDLGKSIIIKHSFY